MDETSGGGGEEREGGVDVFKMDKKQESHFLNSPKVVRFILDLYGLCFGEHDCSKHRPSSSVYTYTCALSAPSPPPPLPYLLGLYLPTARTPAVGRQSHEGSRSGLARRARSSAPGAGRITTTTTILTDLTDGRTDGRTDERTE